MAIEVIRNQPIQTRFNGCTNECTDRMQLVQTNDQQRIQVKLSPYKHIDSMLTSAFTLSGCFPGGLHTITFVGPGSAVAPTACTSGKTYQVQFQVNYLTIDNDGGYRVKLNEQYVTLPDAANGSYSILGGTITAYVTINAYYPLFIPYLTFETLGSVLISITGISISELSSCSLVVLDDAKLPVQDFGDALTVYNRNSNIATVILNWDDVNFLPVCYLALYDPKEMNTDILTNGSFLLSLDGWENTDGTALDGWLWDMTGPNQAVYVGTGTAGNNRLSQFQTVRAGDIYQVSFSISDMLAPEGVYVYFDIDGTQVGRTLYSANGTYNLLFDLLSYPQGFIAGRLVFEPKNIDDLFKVGVVTLRRITDTNNITNPFRLAERHSGTLSLLGICNQSAFGFDFYHFLSSIRVKGRIQYKEYPDVTEVYDFSDEVAEIIDSTAKKFYEVTIHGNPEYIHDAIRIIRLCDNFFINDKEYIKEGNYDLKITEDIVSSAASFLVRDKRGVPENYFAPGYVDVKYIGG